MSTTSPGKASLLANFLALASGHALGLVVPLLTVPYLARVLRPEGWAPVLVAQALASWMILLLDYGFDLSATRAIAEARGAGRSINGIVWSVQHAKVLLVPVALVLLSMGYLFIPAMQESGALLVWTSIFAIVRGLNPLWYFQGVERVRRAVTVDTLGKVLAGLSVFVLVNSADDGWKVLAAQAGFALISCVVLTIWLVGAVPARGWSLALAVSTLRASWTLFLFRISSSLYMQANTILLSVFSTPAAVAAYGGAERIVRASINLLEPLTRLLLPRFSFLAAADPARAASLVTRSLAVLGVGSAAASAAISIQAPYLIAILLGDGYEAAIPVLRWLALLLPVITVATVLGTFWALPQKRDHMILSATLVAGAINLSLGYVLVPRFGALGMTIAVVSAELTVLLIFAIAYWRGRATTVSRAVVAS